MNEYITILSISLSADIDNCRFADEEYPDDFERLEAFHMFADTPAEAAEQLRQFVAEALPEWQITIEPPTEKRSEFEFELTRSDSPDRICGLIDEP